MSNHKKKTSFKPTKSTGPQMPKNWYYMVPESIKVSDIKASFEEGKYDIEIWDEAGVLEIGYAEKASMDIETVEVDLRDEYSNEFMANRGVKSLFFVTIKPEDFVACEKIMKEIIHRNGGFFVGDTEDFTPEISN